MSYILPRLESAERVVAEAQRAATPRQGYKGFEFAPQVLRKCKQAESTEPTREAAMSFKMLDSAINRQKMVVNEDAALSAQRASALIQEAALVLRSPK